MANLQPGARRVIDGAFTIFSEAMAPYLADRLRERLGADWDVAVALRSAVGLGNSAVRSITDPTFQLDLIREHLHSALRPEGEGDLRRLERVVRDLKDDRNDHTHFRPMDGARALMVVDRLRQVLVAYARVDAVEQIDVLRREASDLTISEVASLPDRAEYVDALDRRLRWVDLAGLSPEVTTTLVREDLNRVFVEPPYLRRKERGRRDRRTTEAPSTDDEERQPATLDELLSLPRIVLTGPPGAGKSTSMRVVARRIAFEGIDGSSPLPIHIRATDFGRALEISPDLGLRRYLVNHASERWGPLFRDAIDRDDAFLFIDGLDEVGDEVARALVAERLAVFAGEHPSVRIWASTRPFGYRHGRMGGSFELVEIGPLDDARIEDLVGRWSDLLGHTDDDGDTRLADRLIADIQAKPGLRDLASSPLLLTILFLLAHRGGRLPDRRVSLYSAATDTLLRDWPSHRFREVFDPLSLLETLQPIALDLISRGDDTIGEAELRQRLVERAIADGSVRERAEAGAREVLRVIEEQTGFFVERGRVASERRYGFLHRTFAEYLAARQLAERWERGELDLDELVLDVRWEEVRALLFAHVASGSRARATRLLREVRVHPWPLGNLTLLGTRLVLAALADGALVDPEFRDEVVAEALHAYLSTDIGSLAGRLRDALFTLGQQGSLGAATSRLAREPGDDPSRSLRKAGLILAFGEDASQDLGRMRDLIRDDTSVASLSAGLAVDGLRERARRLGEESDFALVQLRRARLQVPDPVIVELKAAGWPVVTPLEVAANLADIPAIVDLRWGPTIEDLLEFCRLSPDDDAAFAMVPNPSWHEEHRTQLGALASDPSELPPLVATVAATFSNYEGLESTWLPVVEAIARSGSRDARLVALTNFVERDAASFEPIWLAGLADDDPSIRHAMVRPPWHANYLWGNADHLLRSCELVLAQEKVHWVRGAALRTRLELDEGVNPFSIIGDPDFFAFPPDEARVTEPVDHLLEIMLERAVEAVEDVSGSLTDAAFRMLDSSPLPISWIGFAGSGMEAWTTVLADRCLTSTRASTRMSGINLLMQLIAAPPRGDVLARLLGDEDPDVRWLAGALIREEDVADPSALIDVIAAALSSRDERAMWVFADEFAEIVSDRSALAATWLVIEEHLIDHPDDGLAKHFACRQNP